MATLEKELKNAQEEADRPFPKEDELWEKSARLTQLNRELEHPRSKAAMQPQNDEEEPGLAHINTPAPVPPTPPPRGGGKPSILQELRNYTPPAPVTAGAERGLQREVVL